MWDNIVWLSKMLQEVNSGEPRGRVSNDPRFRKNKQKKQRRHVRECLRQLNEAD